MGTVSASDPDAGDSWTYSASPMPPATLPSTPTAARSARAGALDHEAQDSYTVTICSHRCRRAHNQPDRDPQCQRHQRSAGQCRLLQATASTRTWPPAPLSAPSRPRTPTPVTAGLTRLTDASGNFTIDPNSGEIRTTGALDHEAQDSYTVTVSGDRRRRADHQPDGHPQCQ